MIVLKLILNSLTNRYETKIPQEIDLEQAQFYFTPDATTKLSVDQRWTNRLDVGHDYQIKQDRTFSSSRNEFKDWCLLVLIPQGLVKCNHCKNMTEPASYCGHCGKKLA